MKFDRVCHFGEVSTFGYIKEYKKVFRDGTLDSYLVTFDNGYTLDIDVSNITEEDLKFLLENKKELCIKFSLSYYDEREID